MSETPATIKIEDTVRELEASLAHRIHEVEEENKALRKRMGALLLGTAVVLAISSIMLVATAARGGLVGVPNTVEARQFVLRDEAGRVRGTLGTLQDGTARFALQDGDGRERVMLTLLPDGSPGLALADRQGRARAVLGLLPDETANLVLADQTGNTRTVLGLSPGNASNLVFADRRGQTRVNLGIDSDGYPDVTVFEQEEPAGAASPAEEAAEPAPGAAPPESTGTAGSPR